MSYKKNHERSEHVKLTPKQFGSRSHVLFQLTCPGPSYACPLLTAVVENCLNACTAFEPNIVLALM